MHIYFLNSGITKVEGRSHYAGSGAFIQINVVILILS